MNPYLLQNLTGSVLMSDYSTLIREQISARLAAAHTGRLESHFPPEFLSQPPRRAAVLIPLLFHTNAWHVLFIRRAQNYQDPHSGQVSFPGGANDEVDSSPSQTALREAQEEIGLYPSDVHILGCLDDVMTITSYRVTPVVGEIPWPYSLHLAPEEVSRVFTIPLNWLADPSNRYTQQRILPAPFGPVPVIYYQPYDGEILWGASAGFTLHLLRALSPHHPD